MLYNNFIFYAGECSKFCLNNNAVCMSIINYLLCDRDIFFKWFESSITAGAAAMLIGFLVVPVVSLISKKMDPQKINEIFSCYDEKVIVTSKKILVDEEEIIKLS